VNCIIQAGDGNDTVQQLRELSSSEQNIGAGNTDNTSPATSPANLSGENSVVVSKEVTDKVDDGAWDCITTSQSPIDNVSSVVCDDRRDGASAVSNDSVVLPTLNRGMLINCCGVEDSEDTTRNDTTCSIILIH